MLLALGWNVGLLVPRFFVSGSPLKSDVFVLENFGRSKWTLQLVRTIFRQEETIVLGLKNESDANSVPVSLEHTIDVISEEDGHLCLCIRETVTFPPGGVHFVPYIQSEEMDDIKHNVTFVCRFIEYSPSETGLADYEGISKDMRSLMKSSLYSDLTVTLNDCSTFKVHKFILCSRWREIRSRVNLTLNEMRVTGVPQSVFKAFLKYLYTGKIKDSKVTPDLYVFVSRTCWNLKFAMRALFCECLSRSRLDIERKVLRWNVDKSRSSFHVVPLYNIYTHEMTISLDFPLHGEAGVVVAISFPNCRADRPILVCGDISLEVKSIMKSRQGFSHVVLNASELSIPLSTSIFNNFPSYQLTVTLDIGDGYSLPVLEMSRTDLWTGTPAIFDLHSLAKDMWTAQQDGIHSDFSIYTDRRKLRTHGALLAIRSERFNKYLANYRLPHGEIWKLNLTSVETRVMLRILKYIYTGSAGDINNLEVANVQQFAQYLMLDKLQAYYESLLRLPK